MKCLGYYALWFVAQVLVISVTAVIVTLNNPTLSQEAQTDILMSYLAEMQIISNCLAILFYGLVFKFRSKSIVTATYINKMPLKYGLNSIILGVSTAYAVALILSLIPFPDRWTELLNETNSPITASTPATMFVVVVIMAPVLEEILFRGLLVGTLKAEMHPYVAVALSAIVFGFAHGNPFDMETGNPIGFLYSLVLGLIMGFLFVRFNSVLPSLIFHMVYNFTTGFVDVPDVVAVILSVPIMIIELIILLRYKPNQTNTEGDNQE